MRRFAPWWACQAAGAGVLALALSAGRPLAAAPVPADAAFELTVDSIMRGPGLVGYPPSALRWSGDSERLYFEWRPRGEDEPATWEVARACLGAAAAPAVKSCEPRRLTDEERRLAPPAGGEWDPAHRRSVGVVDGDVVLVDTVARTRTLITRTAAAETHARWSDGGRAVTFVRDGGLHRVWVDRPDRTDAAAAVAAFEQLTDAGPPKPRPPTTDSQQFLKSEEAQLLAVVRENEARKARADARKDAQAVVRVAVGERQSVDDLVLAHQGKVAYALVVDKPAASRRADVPSYVTGSSYPELLPGRTHVGDAQDVRRLVAVDLAAKSDTTVSLSGAEIDPRSGPLLWSLPVVSSDSRYAATIVVSSDNKHRYVAALGPTPGTTRIVEHLHDTAWVRALDESGPPPTTMGFVPGTARLWFLSERDGWMHLYVADLAAEDAAPRQLTSGAWEITDAQITPDGTRFLIASTEADAGDRQAVRAAGRRRPAHPADDDARRARDRTVTRRRDVGAAVVVGDASARGVPGACSQGERHPAGRGARSRDDRARDDEPDARVAVGEVDRPAHRHLQDPRRRDGPGAPLHAGNGRREAPEWWAGRGLRPWRRLSAERAPLLVVLLPRVHVPPPARVEGLRRARSRLPRQRRLRPRLAHRDLPPHGRRRSHRRRRRRALAGVDGKGRRPAGRRLRRQLRGLHHADGDVHDARRVRCRRRAAAGDRLVALQPRVHVEHPQRAADGSRRLPAQLADLLRRRAEGRAAHLPRPDRRQRPRPGFDPPGTASDRAAQGALGAGALPGRGSRLRARDELGRRVQAHPRAVRNVSGISLPGVNLAVQPDAVLSLFRSVGALLEGHFRLSSGLHSNGYMQSALVLQHPDHAAALGRAIADAVRALDPRVVLSPALGGLIIGHEVARALGVRAIFAERVDGVLTLRRGFSLAAAERVLVVEDVVTTGKSTRETIAVAEAAGATVVGAAGIINRGGDVDLGVPFTALASVTFPTWPADQIPDWLAAVPVTKPGSRPGSK